MRTYNFGLSFWHLCSLFTEAISRFLIVCIVWTLILKNHGFPPFSHQNNYIQSVPCDSFIFCLLGKHLALKQYFYVCQFLSQPTSGFFFGRFSGIQGSQKCRLFEFSPWVLRVFSWVLSFFLSFSVLSFFLSFYIQNLIA